MNNQQLAEQITPEKALSNLWRQKQSELIDKHIIPMYATLRAQSISYFLKDGTVSGSFRQALEDIMNDVREFIAPQPTAAIIEAMGVPKYTVCPSCEGEGLERMNDGGQFDCTTCDGSGKVASDNTKEH